MVRTITRSAALLALASSSSAPTSALDSELKPLESGLEEESWEDLLSSLASDQEGKL